MDQHVSMDVDMFYCVKTEVARREAGELQDAIAVALTNFSSDTPRVDAALETIRSFFFDALDIEAEARDAVRKIVGIMTTSAAFRVPSEKAMSPGPDDTRIALVIGKPILDDANGQGLERRYVVALRIVDYAEVYLSKVHSMFPRKIRNAMGRKVDPTVLEEGKRISKVKTCCEQACDEMQATMELSKQVVQKDTLEYTATYDWLVELLQTQLGIDATPMAQLTRMHSIDTSSPEIKRMNTAFIEKVVAGMKRANPDDTA